MRFEGIQLIYMCISYMIVYWYIYSVVGFLRLQAQFINIYYIIIRSREL